MARRAKLFIGACLSACCALAFASVDGSSTVSKEPTYDDKEGYAVLSILLDRYNHGSKDLVLEISPLTTSGKQMISSLDCAKIPDEFQSAAKDFRERNKTELRLLARFSMEAKYEFFENPDKFLPPQPKPGEQELRSFSTLQLHVVSAVGFDPAKTHAIAYMSFFCGNECGGGGYHFLRKEPKGWKEISDSPACVWTSWDQSLLNPQGLV